MNMSDDQKIDSIVAQLREDVIKNSLKEKEQQIIEAAIKLVAHWKHLGYNDLLQTLPAGTLQKLVNEFLQEQLELNKKG